MVASGWAQSAVKKKKDTGLRDGADATLPFLSSHNTLLTDLEMILDGEKKEGRRVEKEEGVKEK